MSKSKWLEVPYLRGRIHQCACFFSITTLLCFLFSVIFKGKKFSPAILIYLSSQIVLFGSSSYYHLYKKADKFKFFLQRLDHATIFILISGTQTAFFLVFVSDKSKILKFLISTWVISIIGCVRAIFMSPDNNLINISFYIVHGLLVLPFMHIILKNMERFDLTFAILGGFFYIAGGIMFGLEYPSLFSKVFGFHEFWHLMTVIANSFFFIPIFKKFINDLK